MSAMSSPYDYQREAQAAMSMALAATGDDRQKWVRVAIAWQELARNVADHGLALSSGQQGLPQPKGVAD
jgi:anti-sigma regulatory factor (Ser/Thr protein kinase)